MYRIDMQIAEEFTESTMLNLIQQVKDKVNNRLTTASTAMHEVIDSYLQSRMLSDLVLIMCARCQDTYHMGRLPHGKTTPIEIIATLVFEIIHQEIGDALHSEGYEV